MKRVIDKEYNEAARR